MSEKNRILFADSDASSRDAMCASLADEGYLCDAVSDGIQAIKQLKRHSYHIAVLDAELPELDGKLVCRHIRKTEKMPVILLSKNTREEHKLSGFASGANDYVAKPFYPRELIARIAAFLQLCDAPSQKPAELIAGALRIDIYSHSAYIAEQRLHLSPKEYDLLLFFIQNSGQAFSRDKLLDMVWGFEFDGTDRTVDTHVKSLRRKIHPYQNYIETVWGFGYKFSI